LEITKASVSIESTTFISALYNKPSIALILGSENTGINEILLSLANITVHIPMHGNNSSMNVISAASIVGFEIIKHMKNQNVSNANI